MKRAVRSHSLAEQPAPAMQHRLALEKLIISLPARFYNLPFNQIEHSIQHTLEIIGEFAGVNRAYLFLQQDSEINQAYEWCAPGIEPQIQQLQNGLANHLNWPEDAHVADTIHIPYPIDAAAAPDHPLLEALLFIPLASQETLKGFLGLHTVQAQKTWQPEDTLLLKIAGETLMHLMERRKAAERERLAYHMGQKLATFVTVTELLSFAVQQLQETFYYYHSQIYLLNTLTLVEDLPKTNQEALILYAATGTTGQELINRHHHLPLENEIGLVVRAALHQETVVANDVKQTPHHLPNALLPLTQSEIAIPLMTEQLLIGVLDIQHTAVNQFDADEIRVLQLIANQLSVALSKAELLQQHQRLLAETQRRANELALLQAVTAATARATDEDQLIKEVTQIIGNTFFPLNFGVILLDAATGSLQTHPSYHGKNVPVSLGQGVVGQVAASGNARRIPDVTREKQYINIDAEARSELCVPLVTGQQIMGVINLESGRLNDFTAGDEQLLTTLAQQLAIGIQKSRFLADTVKALHREQGLNEITRALNHAPDLPAILAGVVRMSAELLKADVGLLGLLLDNQVMSFYPYNVPYNINLRPLPKGRGVAWHIVETGEGYLLDHYTDHQEAESKWIRAGVRAALGVPIVAGETVLGALELFCVVPEKQFNERDWALAQSVGRQAGVVLQNRRLYADVQQRASMLATTLAKMEELDRAKNVFIQNVSHELRTPLGIIYGHAELLESGSLGELQPLQHQSAQIITRRAHMLTDLLEDLSALLAAETQEFRRETIDPAVLVNSMLAEFQIKSADTGIHLYVEIQENLPMIMGDPTHLRRVFDNLVGNGFKFTPVGGSITLRAYPEGKDLVIEVADTGRGIPQDKLERVFERFFQVESEPKHRRQGTGLGLALVKEIIEAHRGQVTVESQVGQGSTFQIWLPGKETDRNA